MGPFEAGLLEDPENQLTDLVVTCASRHALSFHAHQRQPRFDVAREIGWRQPPPTSRHGLRSVPHPPWRLVARLAAPKGIPDAQEIDARTATGVASRWARIWWPASVTTVLLTMLPWVAGVQRWQCGALGNHRNTSIIPASMLGAVIEASTRFSRCCGRHRQQRRCTLPRRNRWPHQQFCRARPRRSLRGGRGA